MIITSGGECRGILGVPSYAIDAAGMCIKSFNEKAVGTPYVYPRIYRRALVIGSWDKTVCTHTFAAANYKVLVSATKY
jgi:hypothetical protein